MQYKDIKWLLLRHIRLYRYVAVFVIYRLPGFPKEREDNSDINFVVANKTKIQIQESSKTP
jgi:hypothetical protein